MAFVNAYDRALADLVHRCTALGRESERMLRDAMAALVGQDLALADEVLERDDAVDEEQAAIEAASLDLMSLQQPRQPDLRTLTGLLKAARDLERVADYSCDIAEVAQALVANPYYKPLEDMGRLGRLAADLLHDAVTTLETHDEEAARAINRRDDAVDALYARLYQELIQQMEHEPAVIPQASQLALAARYLERVADHAVNVAEITVFRVRGGTGRPFHHSHSAPSAQ